MTRAKRLAALLAGFALRHAGLWLAEASVRVEAWGDVERVKAGGTD